MISTCPFTPQRCSGLCELTFCWACRFNLSTAYPSLSFFCRNARNRSALLPGNNVVRLPESLLAFGFLDDDDDALPCWDNLPSCSSHLAIKLCSLRSSFPR